MLVLGRYFSKYKNDIIGQRCLKIYRDMLKLAMIIKKEGDYNRIISYI